MTDLEIDRRRRKCIESLKGASPERRRILRWEMDRLASLRSDRARQRRRDKERVV